MPNHYVWWNGAWLPLTPSPPDNAAFPVTVSGDGRTLVNGAGNPWFGVGDSPWSLAAQLSPAEITTYLEDRAARGFNLVLFSAPEALYSSQTPKWANYAGALPFTGTLFASPLNEAYWTVVDHVISEARRLDVTVLFCPMYIGFGSSDGWRDEIAAVTNADITNYGNALMDRYASAPNLMWLVGHDGQPVATDLERWGALYTVIRARGDQLVTAAGFGIGGLGSSFWPGFSVDLDTIYNYGENIGQLHYNNQPAATPIGFLEGHYEEDIDAVPGDSQILRSQAFGALTGGGTYAWFGNNPIWSFDAPDVVFPHPSYADWVDALDGAGSQMMTRFSTFVASLAGSWADMTPDLAGTFVTSGGGSGTSRVTAIIDTAGATGVLGVAYRPAPNVNDVTFDMSLFASSTVQVVAVDPTDLSERVLAQSTAATFTVTNAALGVNSFGDGDWIIVFRVAAEAQLVTIPAIWHEQAAPPFSGLILDGSVINWPGAAFRNNDRHPDMHVFTLDETDMLWPYATDWIDGAEIELVAGTNFKIIEWRRGTDTWRETVLTTIGQTHTINLADTTSGTIIGPTPAPTPWDNVLLERDDTELQTATVVVRLARPIEIMQPDDLVVWDSAVGEITATWRGHYPNFEIRIDGGAWIPKGGLTSHAFAVANGSVHTVDVRTVSTLGASVPLSMTVTAGSGVAFPTPVASFNFSGSGTVGIDQTGNGNDGDMLRAAVPTDLHSNGKLLLTGDQQDRMIVTPASLPTNRATITLEATHFTAAGLRTPLWVLMNGFDTSGFNLVSWVTVSAIVRGTVGVAIMSDIFTPNWGPTRTHHIAVVYDGVAGTTRLYYQGVQVAQSNSASGNLNLATPDFHIGYHPNHTRPVGEDALIDNVRWFHEALTPEQIRLMAMVPVANL